MSFTNIYIHLIWSTKGRANLLQNKEVRQQLLHHIFENAKEKDIHILAANCVSDHIHLLVSLSREQTLSKTVMMIKGESSKWLNESGLLVSKFAWQTQYMGISISHTHLDAVKNYISIQEEHHKKFSFREEYENFAKKYGFPLKGFDE